MSNPHIHKPLITLATASALFLAGCANIDGEQARQDSEDEQREMRERMEDSVQRSSDGRVERVSASSLGVGERVSSDDKEREWLREKEISVNIRDSINGDELVRMLRAEGLNISSQMGLSDYEYTGYGVDDVDGETALRLLVGALGLDYKIHDDDRYIEITPMKTRTWTMNLGPRSSSFVTGGEARLATERVADLVGDDDGAGGDDDDDTINVSDITVADEFWANLDEELEDRLSLLIPGNRSVTDTDVADDFAALDEAFPDMSADEMQAMEDNGNGEEGMVEMGGGEDFFTEVQMGRHSTNPTTGAVTVQGPRWMLDNLDEYFDELTRMYNATITLSGQLIAVEAGEQQSEGLDIAGFASWADGRWDAVVRNNALGGITVQTDGDVPSVDSESSGPFIGVQSPEDGLRLFSNYLEEFGTTRIEQRPVVSTTPGAPGQFSQVEESFFTRFESDSFVGQDTGETGQVSVNNILESVELGTVVRMNPRLDVETGLVRAQVDLRQNVQSGTQTFEQFVGDETRETEIPVVTRLNYDGEILVEDGDIIIVGGQVANQESTDESGILGGGALNRAFGERDQQDTSQTYYFALKVSVEERE